MTKIDFIDWLRKELQDRNWSQAEFARQSKLSPAQITRLLNGERGIGENGLTAIAHALRMPPKLVFEKAGLLPPETELTPKQRELMEKLKGLDDATVQLAIDVLEVSVKNRQRQIPNNINPKTTPR